MRKKLPYTPKNIEIRYVKMTNWYMKEAKRFAEMWSEDPEHKTGAVIVDEEGGGATVSDNIVSMGANGSEWHVKHGCLRKKLGVKTGKGYWLCPGCSPKNHAEQTAIRFANELGRDTRGKVLFLWGHWWACKSCCDAMEKAGIKALLLEDKS